MEIGEAGISAPDFAEKFLILLFQELRNIGSDINQPPCRRGGRADWTCALHNALRRQGETYHFETYPWLVDFIWWRMKDEYLGLVMESEFDPSHGAIQDDFEKLTVFKYPLKVLVFSTQSPDETKTSVERYLEKRSQHIRNEEYLLIGFTALGPRCFWFRVPSDGRLESPVRFDEHRIAPVASSGI
jgi:hypothetical protein